MRLALISDLHHSTPSIPSGVDCVVFGGDFCCTHRNTKAVDLEKHVWSRIYEPYLKSLRDRGIKLVGIPGNHDFMADSDFDYISSLFDTFVLDGEFEIVKGKEKVKVYAFCYHLLQNFPFHMTEARMYDHLVPVSGYLSCDILLSHSPPFGLFDKGREHWGSQAIRDFSTTIRPRLHVFGHVHEARGHGTYGATTYINCSSVSEDSKLSIGRIYLIDSKHDDTGKLVQFENPFEVHVPEWSVDNPIIPSADKKRFGFAT